MFASLSLVSLIPIFVVAALAIWLAGIKLSQTVDIIDRRFNLGEAIGGIIFSAFVTNLPEISIVLSASLRNEVGIAIGNILGGIAIQTVVLVILDLGLGRKAILTHESYSLQLVLEGVLVIIVLAIAMMGTQLPNSFIFMRIAPGDFLIVIAWLTGSWLINKARTQLPWQRKKVVSDFDYPKHRRSLKTMNKKSTFAILFLFIFSSLITLLAGVVSEQSGSAIATKIGWTGVLFGSTILAAVTSLPEISTGLAAVKIGDFTLAISDIFGGNAFLPVLFLPATLLSGESVLSNAQHSDIYLSCLGILLTCIYLYGLIFRSKRQIFWVGIDSMVVLVLYILGTIGLFMIAQ